MQSSGRIEVSERGDKRFLVNVTVRGADLCRATYDASSTDGDVEKILLVSCLAHLDDLR